METIVGGALVALVSLYGGYLLRGLAERRSGKRALVHERLDAIHDGITHSSRIRASITGGQAEAAGGVPESQRRETAKQIGDLYAEGAGVVQDGIFAAEALEAWDLAVAMGEALGLLGTAATSPRSDQLSGELGAKLGQIRKLYEALRDKKLD